MLQAGSQRFAKRHPDHRETITTTLPFTAPSPATRPARSRDTEDRDDRCHRPRRHARANLDTVLSPRPARRRPRGGRPGHRLRRERRRVRAHPPPRRRRRPCPQPTRAGAVVSIPRRPVAATGADDPDRHADDGRLPRRPHPRPGRSPRPAGAHDPRREGSAHLVPTDGTIVRQFPGPGRIEGSPCSPGGKARSPRPGSAKEPA